MAFSKISNSSDDLISKNIFFSKFFSITPDVIVRVLVRPKVLLSNKTMYVLSNFNLIDYWPMIYTHHITWDHFPFLL